MSKLRSDRRSEPRPDSSDRRGFPRPPLWLNLLILGLAVAGIAFAQWHRSSVERQYSDVLTRQQSSPQEVNQIKEELAKMDLTREELQRELDARLKQMEQLESENFYLSVDTEAKKLRLMYGDTVLREGDIQLGAGRSVATPDGAKSWTFIPVKGSFHVEGKIADHEWRIPEWQYVINQEPIPENRPVVKHGMGEFVIQLPNGYAIHSEPDPDSPLKGPKPGSIMASESDLRAIWPRITKGTNVFIF